MGPGFTRDDGVLFYPVYICIRKISLVIIASKLLVDALENFLGTCLKVLNYFPLEASKSFLSSYITVKHLQYVF